MTEWVQNAQADDFWIIAGVLVALAIFGFFGAFYFFVRKRTVENTPTSKIRSAAQGYVELEGLGKLMDGDEIIAPLTGRMCTWYSYQIEERRRSGKNDKWVTIEKATSDDLFLLVDNTGQCVVDPEGASVTPAEKNTWYGHGKRPASGPKVRGGFFNLGGGRYRYTEKRMHPGDPLYGIGLFNTVGGAGGDFNIDADLRDLLREWKQDSEKLLARFDKNKDGEIDMQEWQEVREHALGEVMANHSERKTAPPVNMFTKTTDRRRPFILSAIPQAALIRRFHYYSVSLIILFFVCGVLSTWLISLRLS